MVAQSNDLWSLVWGKPEIDPNDLARAVQEQARAEVLDYRTRLLIRDSIDALTSHWGPRRVQDWLQHASVRHRIESICREEFDKVGFPFIKESLVEKTNPETIEQLFRELGMHVHESIRMAVGGSAALILPGLLSRATTDIDVVDEVPSELRGQHQLIDELQRRYRLLLTHFQSHYLPSGWSSRLQFHASYGSLHVYLVDAYDIFLGKLTSIRTKDLDDLRMLCPQLDKATLVQRLKDTMQSALASESLRERATKNWYILFGEDLPQ